MYSSFDELMNYFYFIFFSHCIIGLIILINTLKTLFYTIKGNKSFVYILDITINIIAFLGLASGMVFQGVISDISPEYSTIWIGKMTTLCIVSALLIIVQIALIIISKIKKRK